MPQYTLCYHKRILVGGKIIILIDITLKLFDSCKVQTIDPVFQDLCSNLPIVCPLFFFLFFHWYWSNFKCWNQLSISSCVTSLLLVNGMDPSYFIWRKITFLPDLRQQYSALHLQEGGKTKCREENHDKWHFSFEQICLNTIQKGKQILSQGLSQIWLQMDLDILPPVSD